MGAELLTTKEVERLVQLNRVTIYRLIREAGFPAMKLGGQWRFPRDEVERWLNTHGNASRLASLESHPTTATVAAAAITPLPASPALSVPAPAQLLHSLEIVSLLQAFATTVDLSILVIDMQGAVLVECLTCRHPFCQIMKQFSGIVADTGQSCLVFHSVQQHPDQPDEAQSLFDCISGLRYLRAPVDFGGYRIGYVVMGPLMTEATPRAQVEQSVRTWVRDSDINTDNLMSRLELVQQFTDEQIRMLADLLSRVVSSMLEVLYRRADALQRLNKIAQLATEL